MGSPKALTNSAEPNSQNEVFGSFYLHSPPPPWPSQASFKSVTPLYQPKHLLLLKLEPVHCWEFGTWFKDSRWSSTIATSRWGCNSFGHSCRCCRQIAI